MSDEQLNQDFDVQVPDIPMPQEAAPEGIKDQFDAGFKFAIVGSGQGGSRLAASFYKLGYRRVCVINTAEQDLKDIPLPESNKLCIGSGGAGKDPTVARKLIKERKEDVLDFMRRCFGTDFDRIIVCAGAGGGTGAGTVVDLVDVAADLSHSAGLQDKSVGVIVALPKASEGQRPSLNAHNVLNDLCDLAEKKYITPLIILDNEKIGALYPKLAVDPFWDTANTSITSLFHLFNTICVQNSRYSTFDRNDLLSVFNSGLITFGATPVPKWDDATDISYAVRNNLKRNILSGGVDLATGNVAGAVIIGGASIMASIPQLSLDHAFDQLTRTLRQGSTVHRGIYRGNKENLVVYTVIGGLGRPVMRLHQLRQTAGLPM